MSYNPRPAIIPGSHTPIKPRDCKACGKPIERPQRMQKIHAKLACQREWQRIQRKKVKAGEEFKKTRRGWRKAKGTVPATDRQYLAWLRRQWCAIGELNGSENCSRTIEAAHVGAIRGLGQKCPDRQAIPLCIHHHRTGGESHHAMQRNFWAFHCVDRDFLIADYNARYEAERQAAA